MEQAKKQAGPTKKFFSLPAVIGLIMMTSMCGTKKPATVAERVQQHGPAARARLQPAFDEAGVAYPPNAVTLVYTKENRTLQLYAGTSVQNLRWIKTYPVLAASGGVGPKLREGDKQVPEGFYRIDSLNPNSRFHLSLRVSYPNAFDRSQAIQEDRAQLGGDIMIHGGSASIGCIAIGDGAIEEVFVLAAESSFSTWTVLLSPCTGTSGCFPALSPQPPWMNTVYQQLQQALSALPLPGAAPRGPGYAQRVE